ncbi:MAG TPA: amino acid adenylation domain-containing protein, partial [Thermoanaerobaculia bacterium]|nr:amino acid adenylation domain-containing protein [Thermoanaerobaculia bacterium]
MPCVDLTHLPTPERLARALKLAREEGRRPFDLRRDSPLRVLLLRLGDAEHVLAFSLHHIAGDAWSLAVLGREVAALYGAFAEGRPSPLPELSIQYADFALWQRGWLSGEVLAAEVDHWRTRLGSVDEPLNLPTDRPRPAVQTFRGSTRPVHLPEELAGGLLRFSQERGATLFMTLLAAFQALLGRYTGAAEVRVGTPIAGRHHLETEPLIGFFVNTLVLRGNLTGSPSFGELLRRVREETLDAFAHQDLPFEKLVEELRPQRSLALSPLFQVLFALQNTPSLDLALPGVAAAPLAGDPGVAKLDLSLFFEPGEGGALGGALEYNTDLFDAARIDRMAGHLQTLLAAALADPGRPFGELALLTAAERAQLLEEWNDTGRGYPAAGLLHAAFEERAQETPQAEALVHGAERLSYAELDRRANRLAHRLIRLGIGPERAVGILLERSAELVVALLAVLKAGGAYVPLDPAYPLERLGFMVEDSGLAAVLIEDRLRDRLPRQVAARGAAVVSLDDEREALAGEPASRPPLRSGPGNLAYVIYTSGSTGRPKGVAIEHRSAVTLVRWAREVFPAEDLAGVLAATSISFDLSVFEIFVPLAWGGKVILAANALELPALPAAAEVRLVNTVPSALAELVRGGLPPGVRTVNLAGEPLSSALAEQIHAAGVERLYNLYGPSEDTTYSTFAAVRQDGRAPSIGRPVADTRAYVVDAQLQPLPVGVPGELLLGGAGLARVYLGRPELTAERFVPDPFRDQTDRSDRTDRSDDRLYRTGDLVAWRADGELEFLGRIDHQVKIRGFRIELGEIEAALLAHPEVREAVVVAAGDPAGSPRLVAYTAGRPGGRELRDFLAARLPSHMVPSLFVTLAALPRTPGSPARVASISPSSMR